MIFVRGRSHLLIVTFSELVEHHDSDAFCSAKRAILEWIANA